MSINIYSSFIKIINNATILTFVSTFTRFGVGIAVLPILILKFNSYEISLWLYLTTLLSLISLASFGFGQSIVRSINYYLAGYDSIPRSINQFKSTANKLVYKGVANKKGIADILFLTSRIYILLSIFSLFLISTVGVMISWNIMSLGNHATQNWISFVLVGFIGILRILFSRSVSIIEGFNFVAKIRLLESLFGLSKIILFVILILSDFKIIHLLLMEFFLQIIANISSKKLIDKIITKKNIPRSQIFNIEIFNQIWPSTWRFGLMLFSSHFINNGTVLVVAQLSDSFLIASYLLTVRILVILRSLSISQFNANYPSLINLVVSKDFYKVKQFLSPIIRNIILLLIVALLSIFFIGNDIIYYLSKDIRIIDNYLLIIMSIGLILETHHGIHANVYLSTNHVPFLWPSLISGLLIVLISSLTIVPFGIFGAVLTQFVVQLSFNNWFPVYLNLKLLKWNFSEYTFNVLNLKKV